jgi:hypothetical protein
MRAYRKGNTKNPRAWWQGTYNGNFSSHLVWILRRDDISIKAMPFEEFSELAKLLIGRARSLLFP